MPICCAIVDVVSEWKAEVGTSLFCQPNVPGLLGIGITYRYFVHFVVLKIFVFLDTSQSGYFIGMSC